MYAPQVFTNNEMYKIISFVWMYHTVYLLNSQSVFHSADVKANNGKVGGLGKN